MQNKTLSASNIACDIDIALDQAISMSSIMVGHENLDGYTELLPSYFHLQEKLLMELKESFNQYREIKESLLA